MDWIVLSFHVVVSVCNSLNGACKILGEPLGPYMAKSHHSRIDPGACQWWGQAAMAQSPAMVERLEKLDLPKDRYLKWECDSAQVARL